MDSLNNIETLQVSEDTLKSTQKWPVYYNKIRKIAMILNNLRKSKVLEYIACKNKQSMVRSQPFHMAGDKIKRRRCLIFQIWYGALRSAARSNIYI